MMQVEALYRETILDHHREPRGREELSKVDFEHHGHNPVCGDETTVKLAIEDGVIVGISVVGKGCAIATASGSILAELLEGKTVDQAHSIAATFRDMMAGGVVSDEDAMGDLMALAGVRKFPVRIKCAALPWDTFSHALDAAA